MENKLKQLILSTPELIETAKACQKINLPNFYIAGGVITQLIWNHLLNNEPLENVKDIDIVYFDADEQQSEDEYEKEINALTQHFVEIDIKNQANVHKWYPKKFGQVITAYQRSEEGINSWLSAFAIGFNFNQKGEISIYAPYGLEDAFNFCVKPNKLVMSEANYIKMTHSFKRRWPNITVEPW